MKTPVRSFFGNIQELFGEYFYICRSCEAYGDSNFCVITPERSGNCGIVGWESAEKEKPPAVIRVEKGEILDIQKGEFEGINRFIENLTDGKIKRVNLFSVIENPPPSTPFFDAIIAVLPLCKGFFIVHKNYSGITPWDIDFKNLKRLIPSGVSFPGVSGISSKNLRDPFFIMGDGGWEKVVWINRELKERLDFLKNSPFFPCIADEKKATGEEEILDFMKKNNHPALNGRCGSLDI